MLIFLGILILIVAFFLAVAAFFGFKNLKIFKAAGTKTGWQQYSKQQIEKADKFVKETGGPAIVRKLAMMLVLLTVAFLGVAIYCFVVS